MFEVIIQQVLEEIACMNIYWHPQVPGLQSMQPALLDKHYLQKHGVHAYYGQ